MVRLTRIYTRLGDDGMTSLGDGHRVAKYDLRITSYGTVDELSTVMGLVTVHGVPDRLAPWVQSIQNDLFDVGADLCVPGEAGERLRIEAAYVTKLEGWIDALNADLEPLDSFILPGGNQAAAWLHLARTTCRRAERLVVELAAREDEAGRVNPEVVRYLNRLSDLLFVMARWCNDQGRADVLWKPGGSRNDAAS